MCNCGCGNDVKAKMYGEVTNECLYAIFVGVVVALVVNKLDL